MKLRFLSLIDLVLFRVDVRMVLLTVKETKHFLVLRKDYYMESNQRQNIQSETKHSIGDKKFRLKFLSRIDIDTRKLTVVRSIM